MAATGKEAVSLKQAKAMYDRITGDLTDQTDSKIQGAVAAEAEAREKADQLLEAEVDGKLDAADLVAGENVTITPDPESGHVTIAAAGGVDVPFPNGTMLIDGEVSKLFAHTLSSGGAPLPLLVFAEEPIVDLGDPTVVSKIHTIVGPDIIGLYYHCGSGDHHVVASLHSGMLSVNAQTSDGSPMGKRAYFGLSENAGQPMIGTALTNDGFIRSDQYLLASTDIYGLAKVDGTTVVSNNGVLSANVPEINLAMDAEAKGFLGY